MNINKILKSVRGLAPEDMASEWDNSGINVLGSVDNTTKLAVALDPTPEFIEEALGWGAGFIATHHPLYFDPVAPNKPSRYLDVLRMLLAKGAWLYGAHTSLDCCPDGPAQWLGRRLGLKNTRVLEPLEKDYSVGFGQVGELPKALAWDDFEKLLAELLELGQWREMGTRPEKVRTVAYLPGSGSSAMESAVMAGADLFITGDFKYHQALEAPLCVLDVGHFIIEEEMTRIFARELDEALEDVEVRYFPSKDPFRFQTVTR